MKMSIGRVHACILLAFAAVFSRCQATFHSEAEDAKARFVSISQSACGISVHMAECKLISNSHRHLL